MRPLKLTLQAFGPYLNKIEIPFSRLSDSSVYLIAGVTGSGKTTIFDAISYALFNTSSGQNRGNTSFKSHFASDDTESFVEFEFLFNGEVYKIKRFPSFKKLKSNKKDYTLVQSQAQMFLPDGKILSKVKEVDEYVKELFGIDAFQFSQIALLAQGEFLKVLNADTQTRGEIFRNIFKTSNYAFFQAKLKDEMLSYKNRFECLKNSILQYIKDIDSNTEKLTALKETFLLNDCFYDLDNLINLLKIQDDIDTKELLDIQGEINEIKKENIEKEKNLQLIQTKLNLETKKNEINAEIENFLPEFNLAKEEYQTLDSKNKEIEKLILEVKKADEDYKKTVEINELLKLKSDKEKQLLENKEFNQKLNDDILKLKTDCLKYKCTEFLLIEQKLVILQNELLRQETGLNKLNTEYNNNYNDYLKMQAGILAKNLKDGVPCPVCGATVHPKLAEIKDNELTKEFLDKQKNELNTLREKFNNLSCECAVLIEQIKSKKVEFSELSKNFQIDVEIKIENIIEQDFIENINNINEKIKNTQLEENQINTEIKAIEAKVEILKKNTKGDIDLIISNYEKLKSDLESKQALVKKIKEDYDEKNIKLNNLKSNIELLLKQIDELKEVDSNKFEEFSIYIKNLETKAQTLYDKTEIYTTRKKINSRIYSAIVEKNKEYIEVSKLYNHYKTLCDCANGTLKGKPRIAFEQYIQGYYLDMVLFEANKRLKIMTKNQFKLLRKKDVDSLQSKTGLELEVMDFHTFKKRSTKTLSGGESFKAALALALGLSDCVANFSGAININAMFIDEGFGSLDSDSMDLAMDVILELSVTNRLIGIISHVDELKSKIQNQIITIKSDTGSGLEVNF